MTAAVSSASQRARRFLASAALSCLLLPTDGWSQEAKPARTLDPVVVQPAAQSQRARRAATGNASRAARARPQRNAAATTAAPAAAPTGPVFAAPTLNLTGTAPTASRLGLTRLQTPASVDVISAQTMSERGQQNINDAVTQNAVGITANPSLGNGGLAFSARGFTGSSSVMTIYDGTQLYVGQGTMTFPYDTWSAERIEVLRGPASVLYGSGAIGGAVNVVSKLPTWIPTNQAEISLDTNMTKRIAVDSGGPVNENVAYRITATGNLSDGWVDRGNNSNVSVHAAIQVKQNEDVTWTFLSDYADVQPQNYWGTPLVNGRILESTRFNNYNFSDGIVHYKDNLNQIRTEWNVADGVSVRNVLYYMDVHRHWRNTESYVYSPVTGLVNRNGNNTEIYQAQQQVGDRMDATFRGHLFGMTNQFVAGFDVNHIKFGRDANFLSSTSTGNSSVALINPIPGNFFSNTPTVIDYRSITNQYAFFAENKLDITEQLSLITGVRQDETNVTRTDFFVPGNSLDKSFSNTTWRAGAIYTPIRDLAFYGQYSTAVDPVTSGLLALNAANANFTLATGRQIEIGVKQSLLGGRFEWTLAGYDIVKNNLLARDPNNLNVVLQVGQQSSRGVEASVGVLLDYGWRIDANTTFLQAKYDDFLQASSVNFAGNVPQNVPLNVSNIWATWAFAPNWSANAGIQIVGKTYADAANTLTRPAYNVVNAGVQWKPDANTTVSLRVYNLFDEIYAVSGGTNQWVLGMPRTAQLAVNVKF
jgi:iron complex outermembrane receptor protein